MPPINHSAAAVAPADVLSKAAIRAADRLRLTQGELGTIIGVSAAAVSRAVNGGRLPDTPKTMELATLFIRVYRSLDAIVGGEDAVAGAWLRNPNSALGVNPLEAMKTIPGLIATLAYLDARRALA
jgi:transcriptional regulator with XRE-family HTH domain